jgi:hypothetical protein
MTELIGNQFVVQTGGDEPRGGGVAKLMERQ